jgi:hypothetical protein
MFLEKMGYECKIAQVVDGNFIDKEVFEFNPNIVIIEALWVSGDKMKELIEIPRYKNIKWVVRVHSDIGFLSAETLALKYVDDYINLAKDNLFVSCNNLEFNYYLSKTLHYDFTYLPNIIEMKFKQPYEEYKPYMNVACFGSLRLLKNQCYQAICAMEAADKIGKRLRFHVTIDVDIDNKTEITNPVLKNLEELFEGSYHELVKHNWLENDDFQHLIRHMDIGLQLSYTESFNIVAADFVKEGVPIIVSDAIKWMPSIFKTSTVKYHETIKKIIQIYRVRKSGILRWWSRRNLFIYNESAKRDWLIFINRFEKHEH